MRENCPVCGGDGRINTSYQTASCPACNGTGRRSEEVRFRDVTKTKPSHHRAATASNEPKQSGPRTALGVTLAKEVDDSALPDATKARLKQSIVEYENRKGEITKTFLRLVRKEVRAAE